MINRKVVLRSGNVLLLIFVLIAAFLIRVYGLSAKPLCLDEADWIALYFKHFDTFLGIPISSCKGFVRPVYGYLLFFSTKLFSSPEYASRIPAVLLGTATVALTYKLAAQMYGRLAGLCSAIFLAFLPWHIIESRVGNEIIAVPFFGSAIALTLSKYLQTQRQGWFFLYCFLVSFVSLYTYQPSMLFIPISLITIIALKKEYLPRIKLNAMISGLLIFLITVFPLLYLQLVGKVDFLAIFYRPYQTNPFQGNLLINLARNFQANNALAFKSFFFSSGRSILHCAALRSEALLIHWVSLPIVVFSLISSIRRKSWADKIILIWLAIGYIGSIALVNFFAARYVMIILIPLIILMGKFASEVSLYIRKIKYLKRAAKISLAMVFFGAIVIMGLLQWTSYSRRAHFEPDENLVNVYGCREAADYLSRIPGIRECDVLGELQIPAVLRAYCAFPVRSMGWRSMKRCAYYVMWAPPGSHSYSPDLRHYPFLQDHSGILPLKTIYYPDNLPAIYIFKVNN